MALSPFSAVLIFLTVLHAINPTKSEPFIGVNYGQVADNLPPPAATAKLLQSTSIQKVRLYGSDAGIIKALANTGIGIMIGTSNGDIPGLASDPNFARNWVDNNVVPFYPASNIILVTVGNEVTTFGDHNLMSQLLPAMRNVQGALEAVSLGGKIKVSTVHTMAVLKQSEPPSTGSFDPALVDILKGLLEFNNATGSPFPVNPYPYFAYRADPRPDTLAFCLFQPNQGRFDSNTKIKYMNMFDAQVDAVRSALNSMGFNSVEIVVAETGWPYKGDANEVGASLENAKAYNGNLIAHLRSMVGTPLMPGKSVDTYLFALYDEDLKPGPESERSFGLFKTDLTMTYDVGLAKSSSSQAPAPVTQTPVTPSGEMTPVTQTPVAPSGEMTPVTQTPVAPSGEMTPVTQTPVAPSGEKTPVTPSSSAPKNKAAMFNLAPATPKTPVTPSTPAPKNKAAWCVPKAGVSASQLQANVDYACGHGIDCSPIQPGGACFEPNTLASHAAYAMNLLYQTSGQNPWNCDFSQTATLTSNNPSYDGCKYPGGST